MAKAGREGALDEPNNTGARTSSGSGDPLGALVEGYRVSIGAALIFAGLIGLVGIGVLGYALSKRPQPLTALLIGAFTLLFALYWLIINAMNAGRRLEVRKRGIRFVERGRETALRWEEIEAIDVDREDSTYLGVASVHRRSSDTRRVSGPTTKTDWDVTIRGSDGRTIRLRPTFLKLVLNPRKLIGNLRLRAGLDH